jgi:hypothetical protein
MNERLGFVRSEIMSPLDNKVVIVTGGSSGIGRAGALGQSGCEGPHHGTIYYSATSIDLPLIEQIQDTKRS